MLISEMEAVLRNLDVRVGRIEQILPTLATKTDLERFATKTDLERYATKADLERFATKADLERFATKADLERLSSRTDLELSAIRTAVETSERRIRVLFEHLSGSVETLAVHLSDQMHRLSDLVERLDRGR
jgi:dsDNA-specific endonuclease/ATPase MutS2